MAFCTKCGAPLGENDRFCGKCGSPKSMQQQQGFQQSAYQQPLYQQPFNQPYPPQAVPSYVAAPAKTVSSFGKIAKWLIPLISVLVVAGVALFIFMYYGNVFKSDEELIRERIQAYEDACNDGDYEAMLDCMDSQTQALMEATMGFMDGLFAEGTGMDFGMTDMFWLAGLMGDYCHIEIKNIAINGEYATVTVVMSTDVYGHKSSTEEAELPMVKEDGDWYIGGLDNMISDRMGLY